MEREKGISERIWAAIREHLAKHHGPKSVGPNELKEGLGTLASHGDAHHDPAYLQTAAHTAIGDGAPHHAKYTDAEAIAAVEGEATLDLTGDVTIAAAKSLGVDTIGEKTAAAGVTLDLLTLIKDGKITPHSTYPNSFLSVGAGGVTLGFDTDDYFLFARATSAWSLYLGGLRFKITPAQVDFYVPLQMNSNKILGLANPTLAQDAATKAYVDARRSRLQYVFVPDAAPGADVTTGDQQGAIHHSGPDGDTATRLYVDCETAPGTSVVVTVQYGDTDDLDTVASWTTIATVTTGAAKTTIQDSMTNAAIPASRLVRMNVGTITGTAPKDMTVTLRATRAVGA